MNGLSNPNQARMIPNVIGIFGVHPNMIPRETDNHQITGNPCFKVFFLGVTALATLINYSGHLIIGSAWDYDEKTDEYYLHLYVSKQPDLNWDNPDVRQAVWDLMRFWIERGCDGFRVPYLPPPALQIINILPDCRWT